MANKQAQKLWEVTVKPTCPGIGGKTFKSIVADTAMDAKGVVVMMEFGHMFTGLFSQMTAKRQPSAADLVVARVMNAPIAKRQQEDW